MSAPEAPRVIVVGAGLAGLCAALAARESGADVVLLEASSESSRGGNSRFSNGSFRVVHDGLGLGGPRDLDVLVDPTRQAHADRAKVAPYPARGFRHDIVTTSRGRSDPEELALVVDQSFDAARWLAGHGVVWELNLKFTQVADLTSAAGFELDPGASLAVADSGPGLVEPLFAAAVAAGVDIRYHTVFDDFVVRGGAVVGVRAFTGGRPTALLGPVVLASGGFEANPEMRRKYLGAGWDLVAVRGTRHNTGRGLVRALALGAMPGGHWGGCHAVPTDADIPLMGDLELSHRSERYAYAGGLLVNEEGRRFVDEGEDIFTMTYTKVGAAIAAQPGGMAYQVFDARSRDNLHEHYYSHGTPVVGATLAALADAIGVPPRALQQTVHTYNEACDSGSAPSSAAHPAGQPTKSRWARPLDRAPFVAYKVTAGISFTYGGIVTTPRMAVRHVGGHEIEGLHAAGGVVGGLFFHNYPAAAALTRAAVCGRLAGRNAAASLNHISSAVSASPA